MAGKSGSFSTAILTAFLGTQVPAIVGTTYLALLHTNPSDDYMTGAVETTYTNYARQSIVSTSTGWNTPGPGTGTTQSMTNKLLLTFPTAGATGDTGINGAALCQHLATAITTANEVYYWGLISGAPKVINGGSPGDPVSVAAGAWTQTEA